MSDTTTGQPKLTRRHAYVLVVVGLLVLALLVGTRSPHTVEMSVLCDTTTKEVRCQTDDGFYLTVATTGCGRTPTTSGAAADPTASPETTSAP